MYDEPNMTNDKRHQHYLLCNWCSNCCRPTRNPLLRMSYTFACITVVTFTSSDVAAVTFDCYNLSGYNKLRGGQQVGPTTSSWCSGCSFSGKALSYLNTETDAVSGSHNELHPTGP